jgi:exodeoxyribonuclease VII small subunit
MTKRTREQPAGAPGEPSFEQLYSRLEEVTARLEAGDLSLDDAVKLYEEGVELARRAQALLADAEQRIERLREAYDGADAGRLL